MDNKFSQLMANKSNESLFEYIKGADKFEPEAVLAAIQEIEQRGLTNDKVEILKKKMTTKPQEIQEVQRQQVPFFAIPKNIPDSITKAAMVLYLTVGLGILNALILGGNTGFSNFSDPKRIFNLVLSLGFMAFIAYMIHTGKNWARITFLVLFLLGMMMYPFSIPHLFALSHTAGMISLVESGLQIFTLILLYSKTARAWYKGIDVQVDKINDPTIIDNV